MTFDTWLLFLPACFALNLSFGPNNLMALTNGMRLGVGPALVAGSGRLPAFAVMIALAAVGLGALLVTSELLFSLVKWAGAAYLIWLGVKLLRSGAPELEAGSAAASSPDVKPLILRDFWVAAGNPKAVLIFTAIFPQFLTPQSSPLQAFAVMGATFLALEVVGVAVYALIGRHVGRLAKGRNALAWINRVSGGMLIGFGVLLALTRRPAT
jgi:threonine/homoserine/homoserine lactone efflux protein